MNGAALKAWGIATGVKAIKTSAQALAALIGAHAFNVLTLPWGDYLAVAGGAGVVCILHNITTAPGPSPEPMPIAAPDGPQD